MMTATQLAALAGVAEPASPTSPGACYLFAVHGKITADLAALGPGLHATQVEGAAETPLAGMSDSEVFAVFVDLALWGEGLRTERAVIAAGLRLSAAIVAARQNGWPVAPT